MTRDEAVDAIHNAHNPGDLPGELRWDSNRRWAEKAVDGYVALGMLKLDEPKSAYEKLADAMGIGRWSRNNIMSAIESAGLKIVEK